MIKVLVVDDSAFMRNAISSMLSSDPQIQVVSTAKDGFEAVAKVKTLKPDMVTLDIEMPRMDGLEALRIIMAENPVPVLMVSSMTAEGAKVTLDALDLGALDFIPKNLSNMSVNILRIRETLVEKIKYLARRGLRAQVPAAGRKSARQAPLETPVMRTGERRMGVLAIGTSTGGPKALQEVLPKLPRDFPVPVLIAQHMPKNFTGPFAERLDGLSRLRVKEARDGDRLEPGLALLAPGGSNMRVVRTGAVETVTRITEGSDEFIFRPSVDALMLTLAEVYPGRALGVILTGMGHDGLKGAEAIKQSGGRIFAQSEDTCVVYGMPKAVVDDEVADKVIPLEEMAGEIINAV
jgi:two-component system chemotaxis response regulator CheB